MTKYAIDVLKNDKWETFALVCADAPMDAIKAFCDRLYELDTLVDNVAIVELGTDEVLWDRCHFDDDEPDDWDREMGFNPYEGCYDYDC